MSKRLLCAVLCVVGFSWIFQCWASDEIETISGIKSVSPKVRRLAFSKLYAILADTSDENLHLSPALQSAIIFLLRNETQDDSETPGVSATGDEYSEAESDYFSNIIGIVSRIHTLAASQALLEPAVVTTGNMATDGVAWSGHAIVNQVLAKFDSAPEGADGSFANYYKSSLIQVMSKLAAKVDSITPGDHAALERRLLIASRSPASFSRFSSIKGLKALNDAAASKRLQEMEDTDPYQITRDAVISYPVRADAAIALQALQK